MKALFFKGAVNTAGLGVLELFVGLALFMQENFLLALLILSFSILTANDAIQLFEAYRRAED